MISTYLKTGAKTLWNFAVLPLLVWAAWYTKHPIFPFALGFLYIISVFSFALICFGFWKALDADLHIPDDGGGGDVREIARNAKSNQAWHLSCH